MSLIWGGKLNNKLSNATSLVSKINFANTYGRMQYSIKAYPSPALTREEWEIVFKILGSIFRKENNKHYDVEPEDYDGTSWILDSSYISNLPQDFKEAFMKRYAERPVLFNGIDDIIDEKGSETWTYDYDRYHFGTKFESSYLKISSLKLNGYESLEDHYDSQGNLKDGHEKWYEAKAMPEYVIYRIRQEISELKHLGEIETTIGDFEVIDRMEKCLVDKKGGLVINGQEQLNNLFRYYADDRSETYSIYYDAKTMLPLVHVKDNKIIQRNIDNFDYEAGGNIYTLYGNTEDGRSRIKSLFRGTVNINETFTRAEILSQDPDAPLETTLGNTFDESIRRDIAARLTNKYPGKFFTKDDIQDYSVIYRGPVEGEDFTGNTIKLMLEYKDVGTDNGDFRIKYGTVFYKWTRTVKYKEYEDDSILGHTFTIDAETFPEDYMIVGETYIRNQKTGKDQRYQITIFKANVSSDTSITLQADGEPTTFSMNIDVLVPENDIMMEMKQIDVEEDRFGGGTRIVPISSQYTYTHAIDDDGIVETPLNNNEIY